MRLVIYGAGGFGREVAPIAEHALQDTYKNLEVVFASDFPEPIANGRRVLTFDELRPDDEIVVAIADPASRRAVATRCADAGLRFGSIVSPSHVRYDDVEIGEGAIFSHNTIATSNIRIGRHFQANVNVYVPHDSIIGDYVTISPNAFLGGSIRLEDGVFIGAAASILPNVTIGAGAIVGMGAVVTKDVPPNVTVVGSPARVLIP